MMLRSQHHEVRTTLTLEDDVASALRAISRELVGAMNGLGHVSLWPER